MHLLSDSMFLKNYLVCIEKWFRSDKKRERLKLKLLFEKNKYRKPYNRSDNQISVAIVNLFIINSETWNGL